MSSKVDLDVNPVQCSDHSALFYRKQVVTPGWLHHSISYIICSDIPTSVNNVWLIRPFTVYSLVDNICKTTFPHTFGQITQIKKPNPDIIFKLD